MPRNGSGIYGPPAGTAAVPNTPIESAKYNAFVDDISEAMTNSVNVNGTAPFQANQPMGGFKLTNLGPGGTAADGINLGQAQSNIIAHASAVAGTADAITATFTPAFAAWTSRMRFRFTAIGANTVVAPTINVDGLGVKTIKKLHGQPLEVGDIAGAGHVCDCVYNGTDVILLNFAPMTTSEPNIFTAKQTFNAPVVHGRTILADATTIAWDASTGGPDYEVTITSNRALGAFTGATAGQEGTLTIKQDAVGGWSLDLSNPVYKFWGPSIENIARGPNEETVYGYKVISAGSMILRRQGATSIGGPGRDLLSVQTAAASPNINFVLSKWLPLYDRFEIEIEDLVPSSNNTELLCRTSTNGGASYDSGSADYQWTYFRTRVGSTNASGSNSDSSIQFFGNGDNHGMSNIASETCAGKVTIYNPRSTTQLCKISWEMTYIPDHTAYNIAQVMGAGRREAPAADVDAIRFFASIGNITSGTFRLYGVRK